MRTYRIGCNQCNQNRPSYLQNREKSRLVSVLACSTGDNLDHNVTCVCWQVHRNGLRDKRHVEHTNIHVCKIDGWQYQVSQFKVICPLYSTILLVQLQLCFTMKVRHKGGDGNTTHYRLPTHVSRYLVCFARTKNVLKGLIAPDVWRQSVMCVCVCLCLPLH